ncbi:hypothetical protein ABEB36_000783 [Hypothenemus hampei]|uniref:Secreted protein n=1 Tax=Hypothenemus hampei TaxID=57062 RepID=A0ABD1FFN3_HYPHA
MHLLKRNYIVFIYFIIVSLIKSLKALPVADVDPLLNAMQQVPQWHCMRYRKLELVRRCRSYKNSLRSRKN